MIKFIQFNIMRSERYKRLKALERQYPHDLAFLQSLPESTIVTALKAIPDSKSQIRQDILALAMANFSHDGFFVEFGATDGVLNSNSNLLEKQFGWRGILAEPARGFHNSLKQNRSCHIETDCVWRASGETLMFTEPRDGSLSSLADFVENDHLKKSRRKKPVSYEVQTISLNDLLNKYNAPDYIDYLSVDTEGSELEILSSFDFDRRTIGVITVEHNFGSTRDGLNDLLSSNNFVQFGKDISEYDDWYIHADLARKLGD